MDAQAQTRMPPDDAAPAPREADDWTLVVQAAVVGAWSRVRPALRAAFSFGSPGSMVLAAAIGAGAFLAAALAGPMDSPAEAAPPRIDPPAAGLTEAARPPDVPVADVSVAGVSVPGVAADAAAEAPAPVGAAPGAAVESVLDQDVVFFWPATPQTVEQPVAIRTGPSGTAPLIRNARPGERLRINGKAPDALGGPWHRVRLADGRDGYFAARTVDVAAWRRRRAAEADAAFAGGTDPAARGAPLIYDRAVSEESETGPPSF
jgi:hypothetical protein